MVWPRWVCIGVPFSFDNLLKVDLLLFLFRPPVVPWKGARLSSASSLLYCARRRQSRPGSRQPASRSAGPSVVAADIGYRVQKRRCQRQFPMALLQGSLFLACARARAPRPLGKASRACMARPPPKKGSKKTKYIRKKKGFIRANKIFFARQSAHDGCAEGLSFGGLFFSRASMRAIVPRANLCEKDKRETINAQGKKDKKNTMGKRDDRTDPITKRGDRIGARTSGVLVLLFPLGHAVRDARAAA